MTLKNSQSRSPNVRRDIEKLLVKHGAVDFSWEVYEDGPYKGEFSGMRFMLVVNGVRVHFRFPSRIERVLEILQKSTSTRAQFIAAKKQAPQTAWANVRDWLEVQFMLLAYTQVDAAEIFLPFMIMGEYNKQSLYEVLQGNRFQLPERVG
jgi:hypothetical protein